MASHKKIKSIVRSLADSFTSLMNYCGDDYIMGHIVYNSWKTSESLIEIDFLNKTCTKNSLITAPVEQSINRYIDAFPDLVIRSESKMEFIASATMTISVNSKTKRVNTGANLLESPYSCKVIITDNRGKEYAHEKSGWWYPEKTLEDGKNYSRNSSEKGWIYKITPNFVKKNLIKEWKTMRIWWDR